MPAPTPQQQQAIAAVGDVLVMAGAGAGKTSTLVARILDRVLSGQPRVPIDRMLVVTFTEAAAAEMRHRLAVALEAVVSGFGADLDPEAQERRAWALDQRALLDTARVSTLHAFCLRLVRDHFHELDLDPQFAVQDAAQAGILRTQILDGLLHEAYREETESWEAIRDFLRRHAPEGDAKVRELILRVHDYARTLPDADGWLALQRARHRSEQPGAWRAWLPSGIAEWIAGWTPTVEAVLHRDPENVIAVRVRDALALGRSAANRLSNPAVAESERATAMDDLRSALHTIVHAGDTATLKKGKIVAWRRPLKSLLDEAAELSSLILPAEGSTTDPWVEDWEWSRHDVLALLDLVTRFSQRAAAARRAAAVVDFADLEQFALALLWDAAAGVPTRLAQEWRERLEWVFVDEYQDINGAQDRIIACVSREGAAANRFFVGDVKQSIYRFRRADPRIFQQYAQDWRASGPHRRVIPLVENFRSHERILDFVNTWFGTLMRPSVGGVAYDAEARLAYGCPEARPALRADPDGRVGILLVTDAEESASVDTEAAELEGDQDEGLDAEEAQAAAVAATLRAWRESGPGVLDAATGVLRPMTWRDMVVLHPSPRPVAERWARQFARAGVPLDARRSGFFEALEVSDLVNLTRVLDNPIQDHPLLAVLRSPLVGMTVEELAVIRAVDRKAPYWDALLKCSRGGGVIPGPTVPPAWRAASDSARAKAAEFVAAYQRWRRIAREGALSACLERALSETAFEAWVRAQPRAASRLANLQKLLALTRQFDQFQRHGLFRFLQFLDAQQDADAETETAPASANDSVRLMSVHQSKGLEFPGVVVAGMARKFNLADLRDDWLLDPEFGVCPPIVPPGSTRRYSSVARWFAVQRQRREMAGEQIRLLYVACTRASERLLLVGAASKKTLEAWTETDGTFADRELVAATSPLAWLGRQMPNLTGRTDWANDASGRGTWVDWRLASETPSALEPAEAVAVPGIEASVVEQIAARVQWEYPWPGAVREPGKTAVTALSRRWAANEDDDAAPALAFEPPPPRVPASERSAAVSTDAVDRGAAYHLFCECVDLSQTATESELASELVRLRAEGWLSQAQEALLDLSSLASFWGSELGHRLREQARHVQRELPFTLRLSAHEFFLLGGERLAGFADDDFQVVQGVVDLAVILPDEIWVVDFKTDRVQGPDLEERIGKYSLQLRLYAHALSSVYRRPVTERWLWFFHPRRLVAIEP